MKMKIFVFFGHKNIRENKGCRKGVLIFFKQMVFDFFNFCFVVLWL